MILGLLHLLTPLALWLVILVPFALSVFPALKLVEEMKGRWARWSSEFHLTGDRIVLIALGILALLDLINAGNAAVGWDAAVHHYAFPKALLRSGALIDVPGIPFSYYPSLMEMLFTLGLGIAGVFFAGALTWLFLFPLAGAMLALGRSLGSARAGLWALILLLGAPLAFEMPFSGVVDLPYFTYCALALAVLLESRHAPTWPRLVLVAILIGCACATKHLALLFLAAFFPIVIWVAGSRSRSVGYGLAAAVVIAIVAILVPLPWYFRSYTATGDPLYPFLSNILKLAGTHAASFSVESFSRTDYPRTLIGFAIYLWHLTMDYWDQRPWFLAIHPAWLALLPPAIVWAVLPPRRNRAAQIQTIRIIIVLAFLTLAVNFFLAPAYPRYLLPTWVCLALISAWTLARVRCSWPILGKIVVPIALALPFLLVLAMAGKRAWEVLPQYWSPEARLNAVSAEVPGYETFIWANEHLDPGRDLILSIDPKIYYLDSPAIIAKPGIESSLLAPWDSRPSGILRNWRELKATHFLLDATLLSVKHGFGIAFFAAVLGNRDAVWLDIETTRAGADEFGIGDILTDKEFLYMSTLAQLRVIHDGTREGRHLATREKLDAFRSLGRDYAMAETLLKLINAGILVEEFRSGPDGGLRIYSIHLPPIDDAPLPDLPDVTEWCLPYEEGPVENLPN